MNGHKTDYLRRAAGEARRASRCLSDVVGKTVPVVGALAILADDWTINGKPTDVIVGSPRWVKRRLLELPVLLTPSEVIEVAAAAHKPATWTR